MSRRPTTSAAAAAAALAGSLAARSLRTRRRARRHALADALHDTVEPPGVDVVELPDRGADAVAHAPGHRHLPPPPPSGPDPSRRGAWRERADRIGHPGRFG